MNNYILATSTALPCGGNFYTVQLWIDRSLLNKSRQHRSVTDSGDGLGTGNQTWASNTSSFAIPSALTIHTTYSRWSKLASHQNRWLYWFRRNSWRLSRDLVAAILDRIRRFQVTSGPVLQASISRPAEGISHWNGVKSGSLAIVLQG